MLIDSHCHLPSHPDQILDEARKEGVTKFITIGTSIAENKKAMLLGSSYNDVYSTVAIYPHADQETPLTALKSHLASALKNQVSSKIVAIGECGYDITSWSNGRSIPDQIALFEMQIELALEHNLPLVIHNRGADALLLQSLQKYKSEKLRGVAHCFASTWEMAQKLLDLNFYISFSGFITYNSRKDLLITVKNVPLDKFVLETDSPYILPKGLSQQTNPHNSPKNVRIIAQKVAEVRGLSLAEIAKYSYTNTCTLFGPF